MQSFPERKLMDDLITVIFKLKARGKLSSSEAEKLVLLARMAERGDSDELFSALYRAFIDPGRLGKEPELASLVVETIKSSDLESMDEKELVINMINELLGDENFI